MPGGRPGKAGGIGSNIRDMRKLLFTAGLAILFAGVVLASGCVNTIRAPDAPGETRRMYLLDLGRHTRLAFGLGGGEFVEYGYGEWLWYAKLEDQWWRVPAVILWPTQGTLGRQEWRGERAEARLLARYSGLEVLELAAAENLVVALVEELDRAFHDETARLLHNERYGLDFVPHERNYWLLHNSNHAVKEWLESTGHEVSGSGTFARWRLAAE